MDPESMEPYSGRVYQLNEDGKSVKEEGQLLDGKRTGLWTWYWEDGTKQLEAHYKDGERHGLLTSYREDGTKELETHYKDGKEHGLRTLYREDGTKFYECQYTYGVRGECQTF